jgi:hypothetical protein
MKREMRDIHPNVVSSSDSATKVRRHKGKDTNKNMTERLEVKALMGPRTLPCATTNVSNGDGRGVNPHGASHRTTRRRNTPPSITNKCPQLRSQTAQDKLFIHNVKDTMIRGQRKEHVHQGMQPYRRRDKQLHIRGMAKQLSHTPRQAGRRRGGTTKELEDLVPSSLPSLVPRQPKKASSGAKKSSTRFETEPLRAKAGLHGLDHTKCLAQQLRARSGSWLRWIPNAYKESILAQKHEDCRKKASQKHPAPHQ